jgi:hypothetical protein
MFAGFFAAAAALAQDIPLRNWTVPAYRTNGAEGGLSTMADITPAVPFVGIAPCRLVDTRQAGFPATYGTPSLAAGVPRNFDLNSDPLCTGIPASVEAYSLNFTVTNVQGPGFLKVFPQGGAIPADISTLNYIPGNNMANAAIVPAGTGGGITVISGVSGTDLIIDINGYFTDVSNNEIQFVQNGSVAGEGVIYGQNNSGVSGSSGILGWGGNGTNTYGVEGRLFGSAPAGSAGVHGLSPAGPNVTYGGEFENSSTTAMAAGVIGDGDNATGENYGVFGDSDSTTPCAAGVFGRSGTGLTICPLTTNIGVLGTNSNVFAIAGRSSNTNGRGVTGQRTDASGNSLTTGVLGYIGNSGVHSFDDVTAAGNKPFVEPHPRDASKQIKYVSLEGNEVGTYFRGRARFQRGLATIEIPEDFRMVTEPEGLSIQITPIGEMASYAVVSIDLERIVVKGSRNVDFFYMVNGVRHNYAGFKPIEENLYFVPTSANDRMIEWPDTHRRILMQNGILKSDGTLNIETAQRLGWDKQWEREKLRIQAEQAADQEADRQNVPEGTIKAQLPE